VDARVIREQTSLSQSEFERLNTVEHGPVLAAKAIHRL